jgi:hypothetical protein
VIPPTPMKTAPAARMVPPTIAVAINAERPMRWSAAASSCAGSVSRMSSATPAYAM